MSFKNSKDTTSIQIVAQMDELFGIDAQARQEGLSQINRHVLRLEKSQSLLERIKVAIQAARTGALPKSALAKACDYTLTLLEPAQSFPRISRIGIEQQLGRERHAPGRSWPAQLDTRRKSRGWTTSSRHHFDR
jgi:Transposase IS66 family